MILHGVFQTQETTQAPLSPRDQSVLQPTKRPPATEPSQVQQTKAQGREGQAQICCSSWAESSALISGSLEPSRLTFDIARAEPSHQPVFKKCRAEPSLLEQAWAGSKM